MGANYFPRSCITPLRMQREHLYGLSGSLVTLAGRLRDSLTHGSTRMCTVQEGCVCNFL